MLGRAADTAFYAHNQKGEIGGSIASWMPQKDGDRPGAGLAPALSRQAGRCSSWPAI
jgi:hypothetical protein